MHTSSHEPTSNCCCIIHLKLTFFSFDKKNYAERKNREGRCGMAMLMIVDWRSIQFCHEIWSVEWIMSCFTHDNSNNHYNNNHNNETARLVTVEVLFRFCWKRREEFFQCSRTEAPTEASSFTEKLALHSKNPYMDRSIFLRNKKRLFRCWCIICELFLVGIADRSFGDHDDHRRVHCSSSYFIYCILIYFFVLLLERVMHATCCDRATMSDFVEYKILRDATNYLLILPESVKKRSAVVKMHLV